MTIAGGSFISENCDTQSEIRSLRFKFSISVLPTFQCGVHLLYPSASCVILAMLLIAWSLGFLICKMGTIKASVSSGSCENLN